MSFIKGQEKNGRMKALAFVKETQPTFALLLERLISGIQQ
jgi:hypothetical protein